MTANAFPRAFCEALTAELTDAGWEPFPFDGRLALTFTRQLGDGFQAVVRATGSTGSHPGPPMRAEADLGVGYGPATTLMPRLTLRPAALLLPTGEADGSELFEPDSMLSSADDLDRFRARVVQLARERAVPLARPYASVAALEVALRADVEEFPEAGLEALPVFLAATGRPDEALRVVDEFQASALEEVQERDYRRFARQLRLWADSGAAAPPPLDAWPADAFELPWRGRSRMSWSERQAERKAAREALDAVRKVAGGRPRQELVVLLTNEYARRSIDVPPAAVVMQASMLELEQKPFGKLRAGLAAFKTMGTVTRETVSGFRHGFEERPTWLEPPDDALFEVPSDVGSWVPVRIEADATQWLDRIAADITATPRLLTHCDAWLRPAAGPGGSAPELDVLIGEHRVGHLAGPEAQMFSPALAAAARYKELPVVRAQLLWSPLEGDRSLSLARPAPVPQPPPF